MRPAVSSARDPHCSDTISPTLRPKLGSEASEACCLARARAFSRQLAPPSPTLAGAPLPVQAELVSFKSFVSRAPGKGEALNGVKEWEGRGEQKWGEDGGRRVKEGVGGRGGGKGE